MIRYLDRVNASCRSRGAIGKGALVPRFVRQTFPKSKLILDYGAGKDAIHTLKLRRLGFKLVAWDIGQNFNPNLHDRKALTHKYPVVMASNVLNVQPNRERLRQTITEIANAIAPGGVGVVNYPKTPRYSDLNDSQVIFLLAKHGIVKKLQDNIYLLVK